MGKNTIRKRKMSADFIQVGLNTENKPKYALCGLGFKGLTETPNAQTDSTMYINQDSKSSFVKGYEWSMPFDIDQMAEEEAIKFLIDIAEGLKLGDDVETTLVQVDKYSPVSSKADSFKARKRDIAVAIKEMTNNEGNMGLTGDFLGITDPIFGEFNVKTRVFEELKTSGNKNK